jgi:hypothetical protein
MRQTVKSNAYYLSVSLEGDGTGKEMELIRRIGSKRGDYWKGRMMRGHLKLFMLQMSPERSKQEDAANSEGIYSGVRLNVASSIERLPSIPLMVSAR